MEIRGGRRALATIPTEQEVLGYKDVVSNWGRWGDDDQLGTMNLLTPEKTARAVALVREGTTVSCARPLLFEPALDVKVPPVHIMLKHGEDAPAKGPAGSGDFFGVAFHGTTVTHLDSLAHMFWDGTMYNGQPASLVTAREGATAESIELLHKGVVGRGVLLDIARVRGVDWMMPGEGVMPEDVEAAEQAAGVRVEEGDILLLRTGNYKRRLTQGPTDDGNPGPQAALIPWLHERGVVVLGSDTGNDVVPAEYPNIGSAVHHIGIVSMGLWILDNANLEELAQACAERNRWEFLLSMGPLRLQYGTGSPVNPIAVF